VDTKHFVFKSIEIGATIFAALVMVPLLLGLTVVTFLGAVVYIPVHLWTVIRHAVTKP
jgi:hypothetical protein